MRYLRSFARMRSVSDFLTFVNGTGSPYHSSLAIGELMGRPGNCTTLDERMPWSGKVKRGSRYIVNRNGSCIAAIHVGANFQPEGSGVCIVGTHTDSPCLRIRPKSEISEEGYLLLGVECYGGGLWHTWFDRNLGLAGKVILKDSSGRLREELVRVNRGVCLIPNLAIHLQSSEERKAFTVNTENHLRPILATAVSRQLLDNQDGDGSKQAAGTKKPSPIVDILAKEIGIDAQQIVDMDICLFDTNPGSIAGAENEFVSSARLDNLASTWAAFTALSTCTPNDKDIHIAIGFDHEEIGSCSMVGAEGSVLKDWIERILDALDCASSFHTILSRSLIISADMAHGVHPNYKAKHQDQHKPMLNEGIVIKENANQRYATNLLTSSFVREIAKAADVPVQDFVVRNDSPCGSTVGPYLAAKLGVRTVDVGMSQWAMHSIRETCGSKDLEHYVSFFESFYTRFAKIDTARV